MSTSDDSHPPGRLHVIHAAAEEDYYKFLYESQDFPYLVEFTTCCVWSGDAGLDELDAIIRGEVGVCYVNQYGANLCVIERRGRKLLQFDVFHGANADTFAASIPFEHCTGALQYLREWVIAEMGEEDCS